MRLLNTETLMFQEFFDSNIPEYAILSHCWGEDEVSYENFLATAEDERVGAGWEKILKLCETVGTTGLPPAYSYSKASTSTFKWTWIDTCCIDKRSSAELSEAINSMYRWYNHAEVCLVFLSDVHAVPEQDPAVASDVQQIEAYATYSTNQLFGSRWFTRGWTLQELVAPRRVAFYNTSYQILGWKHNLTMLSLLQEKTRIEETMLVDPRSAVSTAIATRFSWASTRETSRAEDVAYCLLGLCNVNMPLLYGEGAERAFQRLQLEIISQSTDDSIFAWWRKESHTTKSLWEHRSSFLASSPLDFENSWAEFHSVYGWNTRPSVLYTKMQRGIEFDVQIPRGLRHRTPLAYIWLCVPLRYSRRPDSLSYLLLCGKEGPHGTRWRRFTAFSIDGTRFSHEDAWKLLLGWPTDIPIFENDPLSFRDRLRQLRYKFYPAKTIHICIPVPNALPTDTHTGLPLPRDSLTVARERF